VQKKSGLIFMIYMYMLYDVFLRKQLLFFGGGVVVIAPALKFLVVLTSLITINSLTH